MVSASMSQCGHTSYVISFIGKVMMVRYKHDGNVYAMKMLRKESIIKRNQVEHTKTERNVLVSHYCLPCISIYLKTLIFYFKSS